MLKFLFLLVFFSCISTETTNDRNTFYYEYEIQNGQSVVSFIVDIEDKETAEKIFDSILKKYPKKEYSFSLQKQFLILPNEKMLVLAVIDIKKKHILF